MFSEEDTMWIFLQQMQDYPILRKKINIVNDVFEILLYVEPASPRGACKAIIE